jgi:hypothetical protein
MVAMCISYSYLLINLFSDPGQSLAERAQFNQRLIQNQGVAYGYLRLQPMCRVRRRKVLQ